MNGQDFLRLVNEAFTPFLSKLGFTMDPSSISGRYYRAKFVGPRHMVSVSFEPGDNQTLVIVSRLGNGTISDIDNRLTTPRLSDLNRRYANAVSTTERTATESMFRTIVTQDDYERLLVKCAKELCLVLPRYLADPNSIS